MRERKRTIVLHQWRQTRRQLLEAKGFTFRPCVYIRYIEQKDQYYIGYSIELKQRYSYHDLQEIFYFEEFPHETSKEILMEREQALIQEFFSSGLPLANKDVAA